MDYLAAQDASSDDLRNQVQRKRLSADKSEVEQSPTKPVATMYRCSSNCRKLKPNINKTPRVKKLDKKLRREQKRLSRKYELKKKRGETPATYCANIERQVVKIQRLYQTLTNIHMDYENKIINAILERKPSFIVLEDLNVQGMMKNRHLSRAIAAQRLSYFRTKLKIKAKELGIEVKLVDRFYPSSKKCSRCGKIKSD